MKARTIGMIALGQVVGKGIEEYVIPKLNLDAPVAATYNPIYGVKVSQIASAGVGVVALAVAAKAPPKYDEAKLVTAIAGSRMLVDAVMDIVAAKLQPTTPATGLYRPMVRVANVTPSYSSGGNGGLVQVD